jgi:hypothetical protein
MLVTIDIPQESVGAFRALCSAYGIEIQHRVEEGPAGGNPCFNIAVHDAKALAALGKFYWG